MSVVNDEKSEIQETNIHFLLQYIQTPKIGSRVSSDMDQQQCEGEKAATFLASLICKMFNNSLILQAWRPKFNCLASFSFISQHYMKSAC